MKWVYRLCFAALAAGLLLPAAQRAEAQTLAITGPGTLAETDSDFVSGAYTVTRSGAAFTAASTEITLTLGVDADAATNDAELTGGAADVALGSATVTFLAGEDTKTFTVTITGDSVNEATETFTIVTSGGGSGLTHSAAFATTITDNDDIAVRMGSASSFTVNEGDTVSFSVILSHAAESAVTVRYEIGGAGITSGDYADPGGGMLEIAAGMTQDFLEIMTLADGVAEPDGEQLRVSLASSDAHDAPGNIANTTVPSASTSASTFILPSTVLHMVTVSGPGSEVAEGSSAVFTFSLDTPSSGANVRTAALTATYSLGGTALAADYTAPSPPLSVTFPMGNDGDQTLSIAITADNLNEASETLVLTLMGVTDGTNLTLFPGGAGPGTMASATATIGASDPVTYRFSTAENEYDEASGSNFEVSLSGATAGSAADITVSYTIGAGSGVAAIPDTDFRVPTTQMVTIRAGNIGADLFIFGIDDELNEAAESFRVTLGENADVGAGGGAVTRGADFSSTGILNDNDPVTVTVARHADTPATVDEGGAAVFTFTLDHASAGVVTVPYTVTSSTTGYTPGDSGDGSIDFAAGEMSRDITLTMPVSQTLGESEPDGTISVALGSASVASPGGGMVTSTGSAMVMVNYLSAAHTISFASPATALAEGAAATTYTVTRTGPAIAGGASIVVSWTYTAGTAAAADFTGGAPAGGALTFVGGEMEKTFEIAVADDAASEPDETFTLGLTADPGVLTSNGGVALGADVTVTIGESDRRITLSVAAASGATLSEGTASDFTVSFTEPVMTTEVVNVDWAISFPGRTSLTIPAEAADFAGSVLNGTASIPAGESSANIAITAAADMLNETSELFTLRLVSAAGGGAIAAPVLHATNASPLNTSISASDPVTVTVARHADTPETVNEGGTAAFTFSLSVASAGVVTVSYTVTSSTTGYTPGDSGDGSIDFTAGETSQDITLTLPPSQALDSGDADGRITVAVGAVSVASPGGSASNTTDSATVMVNYVDSAHSIAFASPATALAEGAPATTYTVTRSGPAIAGGASIVVSWTYAAGTAAAADFTGGAPAGGAFTFVGSEMEKTFEIAVADDADSEPDETFTLGLTAEDSVIMSNGGVALGEGVTVTIGESDRTVTLSVTAPSGGLTEGTAADFRVSFAETVTTTAPVTVDWAISFPAGADAAAAADFAAGATSGTASIAAGATSVNVAITALADSLNEAEESFTVTLSTPAGGGAIAAPTLHALPSATAAIAASDPVTVSVAAGTSTVNEGESATFTVTLSNASAAAVMVPWTVNELSDADVIGVTSATLTFAAGTTALTQDIVVPIGSSATLDDTSMDETLTVTLGALAGGHGTLTGGGATAMATVSWVAAAHTISFASPATALAEGAPATTYTVTRTGPDIAGGASIVVSWTYTAGSTAAADFTGGAPAGGTFTFVGIETEKTFEIAVADDADSEPDETFTLGLTAEASVLAANGGVSLGEDVTVTIGASDRPVTLSVTGPLGGLTEGTAENFAVSFAESVTTTAPVTVNWAISFPAVTDAAAAADFAVGATSGTASIAAGAVSVNVAITALADSLNEAEESFTVTLSSPAGGGAIAAPTLHAMPSATAAIAASDPVTVSVAAGTSTVNEGESATFTVTLSNASAAAVMVPWTVNELSDADVIGVTSATLTFAAETTALTQDIVVPIGSSATLDNASPDETLTVTLGALAGGHGTLTGGGATAMATVNWVTAAHTISFASPATALAEGGPATTYTVTRTGPDIAGGASIVVSWTYTAGAAAAADFTGGAPSGGAFTFVGSEREKTFEIAVADDADSEPDETFTLGLSAEDSVLAANGGVALGGNVTVTIGESDRPVTLSVAPPAGGLTEGTAGNFAVSFPESVTTTAPVMVSWRLDGLGSAGAAANEDFEAAGLLGNLEIAAGQPGADLSITPRADALNEAAERVTLLLLSASGGGAIAAPVLAATASAETTIAASDPVTVSLARASGESGEVSEGATANFAVSLSGASAGPVRVTYEITLGGAAPGARIADAGGGSVAVAAGVLSADIAITINADQDRNMGTEPLAVSISTVTPGAGAGSATAGSPNSANATVRYVTALRTLEASAASVTGSEDSVTAAGETAFAEFTARMSGAPLVEAVMVDWTLEGADGANLPGASGASGLARNHGGDHTPDFGAARIAEPGGGAVNADGRSGTLVFPLGALVARTIRVPVLQDALNEGAERLTLRLTDPCPSSGVCRVGGGSDTIPTLQLGTNAQTATIPASDPLVLSVARDGTGAVVSGQDITYSVRFGTTMVNGQSVPIAPSAPLMVSLPLRVNGAASGVSVAATAAAGVATLTISVPAAQVAAAVDAVAPTGTPTVSLGAPVVSGAPDPAMVSVPQPGDAANPLPAPVQTSDWILARTLPGGDQAPEGLSYRVVFELRGSETPTDLFFTWQVAASGANPAVAGDFGGSAAYSCGSTSATTPCTGFPGGRVDFAAGDSSREISIVIFDDSGAPDGGVEGTQPEGFAITISALSGTDAGQVRYADAASDLSSAVTLQASIPALRVDLSLAGATADEGGDAVFWLTLGNFSGGAATLSPIAVRYALVNGSAMAGADYTPPAELVTQIPAGSAEGARHAIAVSLVADGVVEPPETFALTIARMDVSGGGGVVRLVDASGAEQASLSATGTISGAGDAARRRQQRVGALATVLDRQTALLATDAITARLARTQSGSGGAELSIANRNLLGARTAGAANGGSARAMGGAAGGAVSTGAQSTDSAAPELGLALYGAAGLGGAAAGLPGGAAGASGGTAAGLAGGTAAGAGFGGLGAGLAGGANMGGRTALPNLAQLLGGSRFAFNVSWRDLPKRAAALASGVQVWGSGGFAELRGGPEAGLSYKGDTAAAFLGADVPVRDNLLAGLALGWTGGELDFTDRAGDFTTSGEFRNDALSVHPYLGWQISPHAKAWLLLGFGAGSVEIDESDSSGNSRSLNSGGSDMRMFSAGIAGEQPFSEATNLRLRFAITRVQSRVDLGVFDDGAFLPKSRGRSLRVGGEAEVGHRILFANGLALRPFGTLGLRLDNAGAATPGAERGIENESFDWGGGLQAAWPALGLDGRFAFTRQLNDTGHDEQRISATVNFDPGADSQGFTLAMQTAMQSSTGGAGASGGFGAGAFGNTFGANASGAFGAGGNTFGASSALGAGAVRGAGAGEMQQSLSGEIAYAMAFRLRQSGRSGWLTPYARFALRSANTRWAAGLRLAEPRSALQVGLEAALDRNSRNPANSTGTTTTGSGYNLLLTGQLRF